MKVILLLLLSLFISTASFAQEKLVMKGDAFNSKNKLVYVETHSYTKLPSGEITDINTKYHNPNGKLIAEVVSDFSKDPFVPDTIFNDYRFQEKQELTYNKDTKIITMKITDLKNNKSTSDTLKRTDNMVSGQGFHNYILKNFDKDKADIKFIVLPKMDYFSFYFQKEKAKTEGIRKFALKISSWVLRALVKEIVVEYRESDKSLVLFDGLTNIDDDNRGSQVLRIQMSYPGAI